MPPISRAAASLLLCLGVPLCPSLALQSDRSQPINVVSQVQTADLQTNLITFSGEVEATQGSMRILADKIDVSRNADGSLNSIIAYGKPVRFSQQPDQGRTIHAQAQTITYTSGADLLVLQGRAVITQGEARLTGERIEYNLNTQIMKARTPQVQGGRVSTTFMPSEIRR